MKTIKDILGKFREKFPETLVEIKGEVYADGGIATNSKEKIEQFITTEVKELLEGLKGEMKEDTGDLTSGDYEQARNIGSNQREQKLREDIEEALK